MNKIETYIGFAIKKGSAVLGCDSIKRCKRKVYLLLATKSLSENSMNVMNRAAEKFSCELIQIDDNDMLSKKNCKAVAICDKSLADAIVNVK